MITAWPRACNQVVIKATRWESEPVLISANFFSIPETAEENKSISNFLGKFVNFSQNDMQHDLPKKNHQSLCLERTHMIPSDLAMTTWSLIVNRETRPCVVLLPICNHKTLPLTKNVDYLFFIIRMHSLLPTLKVSYHLSSK